MTNKYMYLYVLLSIFLIESSYGESRVSILKEKGSTNEICDLDESISELESFLLLDSNMGITSSFIDEAIVNFEFSVIKDGIARDLFFSRVKDVRVVAISKKCTAPDGVGFEWQIIATIDENNAPVFHQVYLLYEFESMFKGLRKFSFENIYGSDDTYSKLISKEAVGIFDKYQFDQYMRDLGCIRLTPEGDNDTGEYSYKVIAQDDMASRLAGWDFSKKITVKFNSSEIVEKVIVK